MSSKRTKFSSILILLVAVGFWVLPWHALLAQSPQHAITLSWTAPSPVGGSGTVGSYGVYRSTSTGGPYTKLNSTAANIFTYSDTTGAAGTKYFYVVTTIDSNGFESAFSNEVSATAIGNPNPPQGVTAVSK